LSFTSTILEAAINTTTPNRSAAKSIKSKLRAGIQIWVNSSIAAKLKTQTKAAGIAFLNIL